MATSAIKHQEGSNFSSQVSEEEDYMAQSDEYLPN